MPVTTAVSPDQKCVTIGINGRFDFSLHREFREAYRQHQGIPDFVVNLSGTEYLDSSALGMLLLLREHAELSRGSVVLRDPPAGVRKVLSIANFEKLFRIE
ncbi:MAG: STAS domain-containing protein [Gammaproteobacteria bacterium]|nr:STAS domain-containing protein [Gammaproteobacteria bacterium]